MSKYSLMVLTNYNDYRPLSVSEEPNSKAICYELPDVRDSVPEIIEAKRALIASGIPECDIFMMAEVEVEND